MSDGHVQGVSFRAWADPTFYKQGTAIGNGCRGLRYRFVSDDPAPHIEVGLLQELGVDVVDEDAAVGADLVLYHRTAFSSKDVGGDVINYAEWFRDRLAGHPLSDLEKKALRRKKKEEKRSRKELERRDTRSSGSSSGSLRSGPSPPPQGESTPGPIPKATRSKKALGGPPSSDGISVDSSKERRRQARAQKEERRAAEKERERYRARQSAREKKEKETGRNPLKRKAASSASGHEVKKAKYDKRLSHVEKEKKDTHKSSDMQIAQKVKVKRKDDVNSLSSDDDAPPSSTAASTARTPSPAPPPLQAPSLIYSPSPAPLPIPPSTPGPKATRQLTLTFAPQPSAPPSVLPQRRPSPLQVSPTPASLPPPPTPSPATPPAPAVPKGKARTSSKSYVSGSASGHHSNVSVLVRLLSSSHWSSRLPTEDRR